MKKVLGVFLGLIALLIAGSVALLMAPSPSGGSASDPVSSLVSDVKNNAANAAIDASGIKSNVQDALAANSEAIANATGLSTAQVEEAVASLNIDSWKASSLPAEASPTGSFSGTYGGVKASVTTYDNPGYVTVEAYGQRITLTVPESAQQYLPLLGSLQ